MSIFVHWMLLGLQVPKFSLRHPSRMSKSHKIIKCCNLTSEGFRGVAKTSAAIKYCCVALHLRCLLESWLRLWATLYENQLRPNITHIKVGLWHSKKICFISFNESPLRMMKNAFYFTLKVPFVLKNSNFCLDFLVI